MKLSEIIVKYECKVHTEQLSINREISYAFCSDLMSDALFIMNSVKDERILEQTVLITGLATQQSIRTAEMLDVDVVILVRGKIPSQKVISLAIESNIVLLSTSYTMFNISGAMYEEGIKGIKYNIKW